MVNTTWHQCYAANRTRKYDGAVDHLVDLFLSQNHLIHLTQKHLAFFPIFLDPQLKLRVKMTQSSDSCRAAPSYPAAHVRTGSAVCFSTTRAWSAKRPSARHG
mmetsp:Transcript_26306/g.43911  ORF Transcript_26306/g.43911 Transcript_26306/m.43911 type:complete len:103 (-) Transcript_26306:791-1099(-)